MAEASLVLDITERLRGPFEESLSETASLSEQRIAIVAQAKAAAEAQVASLQIELQRIIARHAEQREADRTTWEAAEALRRAAAEEESTQKAETVRKEAIAECEKSFASRLSSMSEQAAEREAEHSRKLEEANTLAVLKEREVVFEKEEAEIRLARAYAECQIIRLEMKNEADEVRADLYAPC